MPQSNDSLVQIYWFAAPYDSAITEYWRNEYLSHDERIRSDRMKVHEVRQWWIAHRSLLRVLLSKQLSLPPQQIEFQYGPFGRPELKRKNRRSISFNLSHCQQFCCLAMSDEGLIGVDIERASSIKSHLSLGAWMNENSLWAQHQFPVHNANQVVKEWTKQEAIRKALGIGWTNSQEVPESYWLKSKNQWNSIKLTSPDFPWKFYNLDCPWEGTWKGTLAVEQCEAVPDVCEFMVDQSLRSHELRSDSRMQITESVH